MVAAKGKRKGKNRRRQTSRLNEHRRYKKKLQPPLAQLPLKAVQWNPDMLPEMFLVDAAVDQLTWEAAPGALHQALDILDQFVPTDSDEILLGTISSMDLIPEDRRAEARSALADSGLFQVLMPEGLRHGLALYPKCPAAWLLANWPEEHTIDWEEGVRYLKGAVRRLWDSKSVYSTRCRMLPLARMIKHRKILFSPNVESIKLFPKYPTGLTEDEQHQVESVTRAMSNALIYDRDGKVRDWGPYFWRHSYEISPCEPLGDDSGGVRVGEEELQRVTARIGDATERFHDVVQHAALQAKLDIYSLNRDEVLFGLLSRQYRLFSALAKDPWLWTVDLGSMFHRAMVDALVTFKWLAKQNDPSLFRRFKEFSLGKQKLLKLHIEELVDQGREDLTEFEEYLSASVNEEIWEEFLNIDLGGNFAGINMRKMAHEVGLRDLYNLVFAPASADLHGEWTSLKKFNLVRCGNPLHRFHRLPRLSPPSILGSYAVVFAGTVLADTFRAWLDAYDLQRMSVDIGYFVPSLETAFSELWDAGEYGNEE
jgi:hypothetical protein